MTSSAVSPLFSKFVRWGDICRNKHFQSRSTISAIRFSNCSAKVIEIYSYLRARILSSFWQKRASRSGRQHSRYWGSVQTGQTIDTCQNHNTLKFRDIIKNSILLRSRAATTVVILSVSHKPWSSILPFYWQRLWFYNGLAQCCSYLLIYGCPDRPMSVPLSKLVSIITLMVV